MKKRRILPWLLGLFGAAALAGFAGLVWWALDFAEFNTQARLPTDLKLVPPATDIPQTIAAFSGVWGGDRWDGELPHTLAVEQVTADGTADIVYALGVDHVGRLVAMPQTSRRFKGKIADGQLRFILPTGNAIDYWPSADGGLLGTNTAPSGWRSFILLKRITAPDVQSLIRAADTRAPPLWQEIDVPEQATVGAAASRHLTLRATLYRTSIAGRQPLVIINHGSAADSSIGRMLRYQAQARFFLSLGYSVVIPMRKGRGSSDGPLIETEDLSGSPDVEIDSGIEDIGATIDQMRAEPFVDPKRIVVVGEQRGGLLSVIYAARHPEKIVAVIEFSGGWWPPNVHPAQMNMAKLLAPAMPKSGPPILWLHAEGDPFTPLSEVRREFSDFVAAGGRGRLVLLPTSGYANQVFSWTGKWQQVVVDFLGPENRIREGVGISLLNLHDPVDDGPMQVAIYYPAEAGDEETVAGVWDVDALRDAPPREGKFPVLLLSHDGGANRLAQNDLATALARQGFMTIAVTHRADALTKDDDWQTERLLIGREYDLRAALDQVSAMPVLGAHVDDSRVGAIGVGFGAYTVLSLVGARPDLAELLPSEKRPNHLELFRDNRVKAVLLLAPGPGDLFDAKALQGVSVSVAIHAAGVDEVFPPMANSEKLQRLLPVAPEYVEAPRADHFAFMAPCSEHQFQAAPEMCTDAPGFDRAAFHAELATDAARFFHEKLAEP